MNEALPSLQLKPLRAQGHGEFLRQVLDLLTALRPAARRVCADVLFPVLRAEFPEWPTAVLALGLPPALERLGLELQVAGRALALTVTTVSIVFK